MPLRSLVSAGLRHVARALFEISGRHRGLPLQRWAMSLNNALGRKQTIETTRSLQPWHGSDAGHPPDLTAVVVAQEVRIRGRGGGTNETTMNVPHALTTESARPTIWGAPRSRRVREAQFAAETASGQRRSGLWDRSRDGGTTGRGETVRVPPDSQATQPDRVGSVHRRG